MLVVELLVAALGAVLVVSGVLKVRAPDATLPMLSAVRLPARVGLVYAVALAEIVVGAAAVVVGGRLVALAVGALYAAFAVVSLLLLRADDEVSCGCFGQRSTAMSPLHVAVNAGAAVVAFGAAAVGGGSLFDAGATAGALASWVLAAALAGIVIALLTVVPARLHAPRAFGDGPVRGRRGADPSSAGDGVVRARSGALVDIVGASPAGAPLTIAIRDTGHVTLLAFLTSGCTTCRRFWDTFAAGGADHLPGPDTRLVVVTRGTDQENPRRVAELARSEHPVVMATDGWAAYGVEGSPYFVLIDGPSGTILGEGAATAWDDVVGLVGHAVAAD